MFSNYDLYDLYEVFLCIRQYPNYELNNIVMDKVREAIVNYTNTYSTNNIIRFSLKPIENLDKDIYKFVYIENYYTYVPFLLKDMHTYNILDASCKALSDAIRECNELKIVDLADCLHNLPISIAEHKAIPKCFWKQEIVAFRNKWDKNFLKKI